MPSFLSLGVPEVLCRSLSERGIDSPFPIQTATLPDALSGRDVLGRGRTGSGKTLAFSLPMVVRLAGAGLTGGRPPARAPRRPRGLVLAPTRELATQIAATLEPLAQAAGLRVTTIFGGVSQHRQVQALDAGVDVVVACPGRLEDLLKQRCLTLDGVQITVLDEADHMADLGFLPGVRRILTATPAGGQRLLFSATLDQGVDQIVQKFLRNPVTHSVDSAESPVAAMTHHVLMLDGADAKRDVVQHLASGVGRRLLFTRTKHQAKKLAKQLTAAGIPAVDLHGNLSQNARERNLEAFSAGGVRVLVATDIAARGIHVDEIELVVHVDPPAEHKAYLHRSGRTARAGSGGDVVTLVLPEQRADVRALTRAAGITAQPQPVAPGAPVLTRLVGTVADVVVPTAPPVSVPQRGAGGGGGGRGRGRSGGAGQPSAGQSSAGQSAGSRSTSTSAGGAAAGGAGRSRRGAGAAAPAASRQGRAPGSQFRVPGTSSGSSAAGGSGRSGGGGARRGAVEMSMGARGGRRGGR